MLMGCLLAPGLQNSSFLPGELERDGRQTLLPFPASYDAAVTGFGRSPRSGSMQLEKSVSHTRAPRRYNRPSARAAAL